MAETMTDPEILFVRRLRANAILMKQMAVKLAKMITDVRAIESNTQDIERWEKRRLKKIEIRAEIKVLKDQIQEWPG